MCAPQYWDRTKGDQRHWCVSISMPLGSFDSNDVAINTEVDAAQLAHLLLPAEVLPSTCCPLAPGAESLPPGAAGAANVGVADVVAVPASAGGASWSPPAVPPVAAAVKVASAAAAAAPEAAAVVEGVCGLNTSPRLVTVVRCVRKDTPANTSASWSSVASLWSVAAALCCKLCVPSEPYGSKAGQRYSLEGRRQQCRSVFHSSALPGSSTCCAVAMRSCWAGGCSSDLLWGCPRRCGRRCCCCYYCWWW